MTIDMKVTGLDEITRELEEMQEGLTLHGLQHWAKEIEVMSKGLAMARSSEEVKDSIHVDVEETAPKKFQIKASAKKEALPFIVEATQSKLGEMPLTSKLLFEAFLKELQSKIE